VASLTAMTVLAGIDLADGSQVWLNSLYCIPVGAGAFFCARKNQLICIAVFSVVCQSLVALTYRLTHLTEIVNSCIALISTLAVTYFARTSRLGYLAVESLASIDALTGLKNRRSFEVIADQEIARQRRNGGVFGLASIDLNRFKHLNNTLGHRAGDEALKLLAAVLHNCTRQYDTVARMGGDEFVILMPNTLSAESLAICRKLSAAIEAQMANAGFHLTASIGYLAFDHPPASTSDALHQVDLAMYAAKVAGDGSVVDAGCLRADPCPARMADTRL
jgi:diguanylate cyclase (GGDEF)-like protein